jgi:hypothetical protein
MRGVTVGLGVPLLIALASCSASDGSDANASGGSGNSGGSSSGGSGGSVELDAAGSDAAAGECTNVDLLFVVDNSASMADQQQSLIASFGGFVSGIQQRLAKAQSYHVGVVTSDAYYQNAAGCTAIGDLITQTSGLGSSNQNCAPFSSGARFMDSTEPNLTAKFACAAQVGVTGSDDERPMRSLLDAVSPQKNAPGACNAGFSRPDSLLVVVIITDEDDVPDQCDGSGTCVTYGSGGDPDSWYAEIVAHKAGLAQNIVVLSLLGRKLDNTCGAVVASKLIGFTNRFGVNGHLGDVCATSYDQFFTDALPVIDVACQNYEPPK